MTPIFIILASFISLILGFFISHYISDLSPSPIRKMGLAIFHFSTIKSHRSIRRAQNLMIKDMATGSLFIDQHRRIIDANNKVLGLMDQHLSNLYGKSIDAFSHPLISSVAQILNPNFQNSIIYMHKRLPLHEYYLIKSSTVYDVLKKPIGTLVLLTDVTELQHSLNQLEYIGHHDDLTGVYNRYYFQRKLKELDNSGLYPLAIVVGDMNGLKYVNDSYGHTVGDSLLVEAAEQIASEFPPPAIVCRIGGDEFVILVPHVDEAKLIQSIKALETYHFSLIPETTAVGIALDYALKKAPHEDLYQLFKKADANMYRKKALQDNGNRDYNLMVLQRLLAGKDIETVEHLHRTAYLAKEMAMYLNLDSQHTSDLILLSQLHDIGKILIPDRVLNQKGNLDQVDWHLIQSHSKKGYDILFDTPALRPLAQNILYHHEHYDGTGYPEGLKGEAIPYLARIIAIIDAYDSITHNHSYKKASSSDEAIAELEACKGSQFDPELTDAFIAMLQTL